MKHTILSSFPKPYYFAHRGASSIAPENTMASFARAVELGCPGIELDIHLCRSGELVVMHDYSLKRTARIVSSENNIMKIEPAPDVRIENLTLEEIRKYDAGAWFHGEKGTNEFAGEKIPLLEDVLNRFKSAVYFDIEIKTESLHCREIALKTARLLEKYYTGNMIVSSFNPAVLYYFKKYSKIPTALIYADDPEVPSYLRRGQGRFIANPDILKPCWKDFETSVSKNAAAVSGVQNKKHRLNRLRSIHTSRRPMFFWTTDSIATAQELLDAGAQALITNRPQDFFM